MMVQINNERRRLSQLIQRKVSKQSLHCLLKKKVRSFYRLSLVCLCYKKRMSSRSRKRESAVVSGESEGWRKWLRICISETDLKCRTNHWIQSKLECRGLILTPTNQLIFIFRTSPSRHLLNFIRRRRKRRTDPYYEYAFPLQHLHMDICMMQSWWICVCTAIKSGSKNICTYVVSPVYVQRKYWNSCPSPLKLLPSLTKHFLQFQHFRWLRRLFQSICWIWWSSPEWKPLCSLHTSHSHEMSEPSAGHWFKSLILFQHEVVATLLWWLLAKRRDEMFK